MENITLYVIGGLCLILFYISLYKLEKSHNKKGVKSEKK